MKGQKLALACSVVALIAIVAWGRDRMRPAPARQLQAAAHASTRSASSRSPEAADPAAAPTVNAAAYRQRMLALANLPVRNDCVPRVGHARLVRDPRSGASGSARLRPTARSAKDRAAGRRRPCPAPLWPAHAPLPLAGALLPFHRIVAYYGNFYSSRMGILGADSPAEVIAKLKAQAAAWAQAAPGTPVIPALDYIAVAAQNVPGRDGMYRLRMPPSQIQKAIGMASQIHGLLFLDVQPGWSTVQIEVPRLASYLKLPNVELALDPEFDLPRGGKHPGQKRGAMSAADINFAARFLARIVENNHLSPKILVVHRFTQGMVTDYRAIHPLPQVQIVMDMDGFGSPSLKIGTYRSFIAREPVQFTGFKLFYFNDVKYGGRLMTPRQVLALSPRPIYIVYQ